MGGGVGHSSLLAGGALQHPAGLRALGKHIFQCFPDPSTPVSFKNTPLIQSSLGVRGGPGWACWLCQLRLPPVTELLGKGGSVFRGMSVREPLVILGGARREQTARLSFRSQLVLIQDVFAWS